VDPATRPTDTTDSRKKEKADLPPSSDTTAINGSKPDAPARNNGPFQGHTVITAEDPPGPVKKKKTKCRQERDSRKWGEYIQRIKARHACPDVPGAAPALPRCPLLYRPLRAESQNRTRRRLTSALSLTVSPPADRTHPHSPH
jgi:hypothetical protein